MTESAASFAMPTATDRRRALTYSRRLLESILEGRDEPPLLDGTLFQRAVGVFVTLWAGENLRGCVGRIEPATALARTLREVTLEAALHDPRFPPLHRVELAGVTTEHSLLSPLRPVADPREFEPGVDGVLLESPGHRAVFLPEVAARMGWGRIRTLEELSRKAGLPRDAWSRSGVVFRLFRTVHYREGDDG